MYNKKISKKIVNRRFLPAVYEHEKLSLKLNERIDEILKQDIKTGCIKEDSEFIKYKNRDEKIDDILE